MVSFLHASSNCSRLQLMGLMPVYLCQTQFFLYEMIKTKTTLSALILLTSMFFASCKQQEEGEEDLPTIVPVQSVTAMMDGNAFNATLIVHEVLDGIHVFVCTNTSGDVLTLKLTNIDLGEHVINIDDPTITFYTGGYIHDQTPAPSGSINITEKTNYRISGNFETAVSNISETGQTIQITSGAFSQLEY